MHIEETSLVRYGALAGMVGGALRILSTFIPYVPDSPGLEALYGIVDTLLLFGLMGIYSAVAGKTGGIGLAGFIIAMVGLASIVGPDPVRFGIDFYVAGSVCLLIGLTILSAALLVAGRLRLPAGLWIASFVLALAGAGTRQPVLVAAAGAALGLAFLLAGFAVNSSSAGPGRVRR
ncbi:MAG: hypothetical protein H6847_00590 [Hyphomonas sp.]|nr:hypothetical protein [Hyphomonas sp.]MCB9969978.1 hypothetical protein [Hyphomonas sp.]